MKEDKSKLQLIGEIAEANNKNLELIVEINKLSNKIDKAIEYITSYESIEEIQHCERIEDNKELDNNTMIEMTNRYVKVHDKILSILRGEDNE